MELINWLKAIVTLLILVSILASMQAYTLFEEQTYKEGYTDAINDVILVSNGISTKEEVFYNRFGNVEAEVYWI